MRAGSHPLAIGILRGFDSRRLHCTKNRLRRPVRERTFSSVAESERLAARAETLDYRLAATGREAAEDERLDLLEQIYDPISRLRRGLVQPGWRCLEVGAGRGSMAAWLADQVGATGHVVATDVDTRYLSRLELPNLEVIEHNILEDPIDVLRPGSFDLVCSRLMLFHLKGRQEQAIRQMAACLRPGGWLLDEDADWGTATPVDPAHPLYNDYHGSGETETGGRLVDTTRRLVKSCPRCSSAAGSKTSAMRRPRKWCAEARSGRDGGSRPSRSSTSSAVATRRHGVRSR